MRAEGLTDTDVREIKRSNGYIDRHKQRRAEEAAVEESLMRGTREQQRSDREVLGFTSLNLDQVTSKIIFGRSPKQFRRSWAIG
jgi:hypothetical protein